MKIVLLVILLVLLVVLIVIPRCDSTFSEPSPKLKILISTCKTYRDKSIPPLLEQLADSGVPKDSILIVSGGEDVDDSSDPVLKKVRYQFWEYTGLIYVSENPENTPVVYLMIHDTVKIKLQFWENIQSKFKDFLSSRQKGARLLENNGRSSMSMGFYSQELIRDHQDFLASLKDYGTDENSLKNSKQKGFGLEDHMIKEFDVIFKGPQVIITEDTAKCTNEIPELGFTKIQNNCGLGNPLVFTYEV